MLPFLLGVLLTAIVAALLGVRLVRKHRRLRGLYELDRLGLHLLLKWKEKEAEKAQTGPNQGAWDDEA